jgi:adenylylsulfate kinase
MVANGKGFIVWLTGLSGAGKSTLAQCIQRQVARDRAVEVLDGDDIRRDLCRDLGFSKEDRNTNVLRIGYVAKLLARHGVAVIVAAISPYSEARDEVRRRAVTEGITFLEVFAHAQLQVLVARDRKGLYAKALAGQIANFTGVSDPYEPPARPDLVVRTDCESISDSANRIIALLEERGMLARPSGKHEPVSGLT